MTQFGRNPKDSLAIYKNTSAQKKIVEEIKEEGEQSSSSDE